jgi:hypothetical protein
MGLSKRLNDDLHRDFEGERGYGEESRLTPIQS